ncbi:MAG: twin-arginine translocase TatA/TatE family subunit [Planctomycetes bacterium]|nr:twin-arginine translocase TatA/TatE family subunit [Planctomycetota bacterium]
MGFGPIGFMEMLVIGVLAVLLFGNKLPSVARSLGKSLTEFKKGMSGLQDEFHSAMSENQSSTKAVARRPRELDDREEATAPKFEPPTSEPSPG